MKTLRLGPPQINPGEHSKLIKVGDSHVAVLLKQTG